MGSEMCIRDRSEKVLSTLSGCQALSGAVRGLLSGCQTRAQTSGAQSDGLTATHGLFTGGEAAHVLRMTYARVAAAVSSLLK